MAYYSGTASSLADLRTALLTHAQADGWVLTGDVLSKAGVYFQIRVTATHITCLGCENNAVANPSPSVVRIGQIYVRSGGTTREVSFPCNYEVFGFSQELYLVANYDVDTYQWMAFGKSTVPGLPGQGGWCGATGGISNAASTLGGFDYVVEMAPADGGSSTYGTNCMGLFWSTNHKFEPAANAWVNSGFDSLGWNWSTGTQNPIGIRHITKLIELQPSGWNSEATLLPIRAFLQRPSFKASLLADLDHARTLRIDNLAPGDILTLGSDKWKVFPWYRKNTVGRSGGGAGGSGYDHTGTFGWAIRYEGP